MELSLRRKTPATASSERHGKASAPLATGCRATSLLMTDCHQEPAAL